MKSAKEMFEELGYEHFNNELRISYNNFEKECKLIEFQLNEKKMILADDSEEIVELSIQEIKAIKQQCKELGWIE